ncbi:MAG: hypothetical protein ACRECA_05405, partial [Pseudolabrys sp.]
RVADLSNPILQPWAKEELRKANDRALSGKPAYTPKERCWPIGVPGWMLYPVTPVYFLQTPNVVTMIWQEDHMVRHIYLTDKHSDQVKPSWFGESIGHYENGDTLVIDTIGFKPGPNAMIDNYGTPFSAQLHLVERIRLIDGAAATRAAEQAERDSGRVDVEMGGASIDPGYKGRGLQIYFTVDDPDVFTKPWSAQVTYRRSAGAWEERVCADNPHNYTTGADVPVPHATKPDF